MASCVTEQLLGEIRVPFTSQNAPLTPSQRPARLRRIPAFRIRQDRRQHGRLLSRETARADAEIMLRGCFDPVDPAPHLDHVCIQLQDAPLRQQHFHPDRVIRFQSFPDPGAALPEEDRPGALVRDRGSSTNRFLFPLRFFHREFHLLPVKALVLEESLIFRYPKVLQEHLRDLRQIDPAIEERTLWRFRECRAALFDQHRQRPRRIDESHHCHLHCRDQEQNHEQNQNPFFPDTA